MTVPKIAIYTAIFGQYDPLKSQVKQDVPVDFICFTDQEITHADWRVISVAPEQVPRKQAKYYKLLPHHVPELQGYDYTIWIDGSFVIQRPDFVHWAIGMIQDNGWAIPRHNTMNCIYDEAPSVADISFYRDMPILQQAETYRAEGYPAKNGLYLCGMIVRDMRRKEWKIICDQWWHENITHSLRDQISLPYVLWKNKAAVDVIETDLYDNPFVTVDNIHRRRNGSAV